MKSRLMRPSVSMNGKEDTMKLSISSPIVVLVGPFRRARGIVSAVVDVGPKPGRNFGIALGGKRAHRARVAPTPALRPRDLAR
jgi:hypothetical protein